MSPSKPAHPREGAPEQGTQPKKPTTSLAATPSNPRTLGPTPQQFAPSQRALPLPILPPVGAQPQLGTRKMNDLLRGNRTNYVGVNMNNVPVCRVLRPLAKHFSRRWRRELANIHCTTVNIIMPTPGPATNVLATSSGNVPNQITNTPGPATSALASSSGSAPTLTNHPLGPATNALPNSSGSASIPPNQAPATTPENSSPTPADTNAVLFTVQWITRGGADPTGQQPLLYPKTNPEMLKKLRDLVTWLGIDPLIVRTDRDLAAIRPKFCTLCRSDGHLRNTCVYCKYCRERNHLVADCPKLKAKLARDEEQAKWKAWKEKDQARRDEERARREDKQRKYMIDKGELAVGDGGKTMPTWPFSGR